MSSGLISSSVFDYNPLNQFIPVGSTGTVGIIDNNTLGLVAPPAYANTTTPYYEIVGATGSTGPTGPTRLTCPVEMLNQVNDGLRAIFIVSDDGDLIIDGDEGFNLLVGNGGANTGEVYSVINKPPIFNAVGDNEGEFVINTSSPSPVIPADGNGAEIGKLNIYTISNGGSNPTSPFNTKIMLKVNYNYVAGDTIKIKLQTDTGSDITLASNQTITINCVYGAPIPTFSAEYTISPGKVLKNNTYIVMTALTSGVNPDFDIAFYVSTPPV